jgi:hypothetical protein
LASNQPCYLHNSITLDTCQGYHLEKQRWKIFVVIVTAHLSTSQAVVTRASWEEDEERKSRKRLSKHRTLLQVGKRKRQTDIHTQRQMHNCTL